MEAAAGHELDDAGRRLADAVYAETEGNPFFVSEVLRHLVETGGVRREGDRWVPCADRRPRRASPRACATSSAAACPASRADGQRGAVASPR